MLQDVFGFPIDLCRPQDLGFLRNYGLPFFAQARPQSGTLCFGMESARYGRLLIRFAGAAITDGIAPEAAVAGLQNAMPIYERLYPHPALIKLQGHGPAAGGYAAIFRWAEGVSLCDEDARQELRRQPLLSRLRMIDSVFDFHLFAAKNGYAPVAFSDGSLIADFAAGSVAVCDIDLYRPMPAENDRGRMHGSSHFMSPEEFALGAPLDGLSAQYNMGALAFFFFGEYGSRERAAWTAGEPLYRVAERACRERREKRWPSLEDFVNAWRGAAGETM